MPIKTEKRLTIEKYKNDILMMRSSLATYQEIADTINNKENINTTSLDISNYCHSLKNKKPLKAAIFGEKKHKIWEMPEHNQCKFYDNKDELCQENRHENKPYCLEHYELCHTSRLKE